MTQKALRILLPKDPPESIRLFSFGENDTTHGVFVLDQDAANAIMQEASDWGNEYHFDYEHQIMEGGPAPAAGWFNLALKDDGLYAENIGWTERAAEMIRQLEYRYISPLFEHVGNRITGFINAAVTNYPATKQMAPLSKEKEGNRMKTVLTALSLAETASEAEALARVQSLQGDREALIALTGTATWLEALAKVQAWQGDAEKAQALQAEIDQMEADSLARAKDQLIQQGLKDGKLSPKLKAWAEEQTVDALSRFLEAAPKIVHTTPLPHNEVTEVSLSRAIDEVGSEWSKAGKTHTAADLIIEARRRYPHLQGGN